MILYTLRCTAGHTFESWFASSSSYEEQRARGFVSCPHCGSGQVEKAIMAPAVARMEGPDRPQPEGEGTADAPAPAVPELATGPAQELRELIRRVRAHVVQNADYVGDEFATLARDMHEGKEEQRNIYGEVTPEDVKALQDDDIDIIPLPTLPEERN